MKVKNYSIIENWAGEHRPTYLLRDDSVPGFPCDPGKIIHEFDHLPTQEEILEAIKKYKVGLSNK
jgi:hypothetical protein